MSIIDTISLFTVMVSLAIIPSTSVALVVTRSATLGISNGIAVVLGIVLGDLVFILLAILGLSVITETMGGLFLTLGDIKAIFFYVSLFPAFVDLETLKLLDILMIIVVTILTVGGVKVAYVFLARNIVTMSRGLQLGNGAKKLAGGLMMGVGGYLLLKT